MSINEECSVSNSNESVSPGVIPVCTPGGTKSWIPCCSNDVKPYVGMKFSSVEEGISFYKSYANEAGFNTRKSTTKRRKNGVISFQYLVCNKAGYRCKRKFDVQDKGKLKEGMDDVSFIRRRLVTRVGCKAQIVLKICDDGSYVISNFQEGHSHALISTIYQHFQKSRRNLSILHKKMIVDNSKINVGPVKTFRMMKEYVGGYENVGASKCDFKNFHRDLKAYIEGSDAQMFVDNFKQKKLMWSAFFFDYQIDDDDCLCRALWADPICRKNYGLFGDMVSFDTTYQTNRYNMVFGPFTGVDHHKKCITFAAGFIAKEDVNSFEWLFRTFLRAMDQKEPNCLITDQDPAMKIAVNNVFKKCEHRFCMWHIMKKIPDKIGRSIIQDTDFLKRISDCVWNLESEPQEFEEKWNKVLVEFHLEDHEWLRVMFEMRKMWIPAYFRDIFMGGIMRTTSRSESENNFFTSFVNPHVSLVEFLMRFESAMDAQRHTQSQNDNDSQHKHPECKTQMGIERHGSEVYTINVFYDFQDEVYSACYECGVEELRKEEGLEVAKVSEGNRRRSYEVLMNLNNCETNCSCKLFNRQGIPCRHMIWLWKAKNIVRIPEQYVVNRWTTMAMQKPMFDLDGKEMGSCSIGVERKGLLNELWSEIHSCVSLAEGNEDSLVDLVRHLQDFRLRCEEHNVNASDNAHTNEQVIENLIGSCTPSQIIIKPPKISKNKGTGIHSGNEQCIGSSKRYKGEKEKAVEQSKRKKRLCRGCGALGYHDVRNCPDKISTTS